jgi:hypothetical protein
MLKRVPPSAIMLTLDDMAANILKEFWPDPERRFKRKHSPEAAIDKALARK